MLVQQFRLQKDIYMCGFGMPLSAHQSSFIRTKPYKISVTISFMTFSTKYKSMSAILLKMTLYTI